MTSKLFAAARAAAVHQVTRAQHEQEQATKKRLIALIHRLPAESLFKERIADVMPLAIGKPHFFDIPASAEVGLSRTCADLHAQCDEEAKGASVAADDVAAMHAQIDADYAAAGAVLLEIA